MFILDEATSPATTTLLIALLGSGGLVGGLVALFKLRGDRDTAAVAQASGAMETMATVNKALVESLARANQRADYYKAELEKASAELERLSIRWGPFGDDEV